jgi:Ni2+-binding GTPase involved in maturation of urease and hydrogenase
MKKITRIGIGGPVGSGKRPLLKLLLPFLFVADINL